MSLDDHGQPKNQLFNLNQNRRKALQDLLGICQGIIADQEINSDEALYLDTWLRNNGRYLGGDPDYHDLLELTTDILEDGITTAEELDDLKELVDTVLEYRSDSGFANYKEAVQRLLGIFHGISSDRELNEAEILLLQEWLQVCSQWENNIVVQKAYSLVCEILEDGLIESEERERLLKTLEGIAGQDMSSGITDGLSMSAFHDDVVIDFEGKAFCFSGKFQTGTRSQCHDITKELGATIHKTVTQKTDFLVVGDLSSRDWAHTSFGRKIEKALLNREAGLLIAVVAEKHWRKYV